MRTIATTEDPAGKVSKPAAADVVVAGICLPNKASVKWVNRLKEEFPSIAFLMLAENTDIERIVAALKVGPNGYRFKLGAARETGASVLSGREQEILAQLSKGYANKEIAGQMHISLSTVRTHLRNIYKKLNVRCRTEAVVRFGRQAAGPVLTFS